MYKLNTFVLACLLVLTSYSLQAAGRTYDVLELPAVQSPLAQHSLVYSLTRAGDRFIATGIRGHILYSDDFGSTWTQAESVPVRSSLLNASFATPQLGWVVGHEGVVLHTRDGGVTWSKQLDGIKAAEVGLAYYEERLLQEPDNERLSFLADEMKLAEEQGADKPFFAAFMRDEERGFVFGAYGLAFRTTNGGLSWYPIMELVDMFQLPHLFDFAIVDSDEVVQLEKVSGPADVVVVGEMGTVLRHNPETDLWEEQDFPYEGSMFTIARLPSGDLVAGGLRGQTFRSEDGGQSRSAVNKPPTGAIVASTVLDDGRLVLASQEGGLLISVDDGKTFTPVPVKQPRPLSDVIEGRPGELILSGDFGVRTMAIPQ